MEDQPSGFDPASVTGDPEVLQRATEQRATTPPRVAPWGASDDRTMTADERAFDLTSREGLRHLVAIEGVGPKR